MGSWSVYCAISNIAITSGEECAIVPLSLNEGKMGYSKYIPCALPIWGKYNDYGGLENIQTDKNTELLERVTKVYIDEFVEYLVDGKHTYNRSEVNSIRDKIENVEIMETIRFCWVRKDVYESLSTDLSKNIGFDMGADYLLRELGFNFLRKDESLGRYNKIYEKDGVEVMSDGVWLQDRIYSLSDMYEKYNVNKITVSCKYDLVDKMSKKDFLKNIHVIDVSSILDYIDFGIVPKMEDYQIFDFEYAKDIDSFRKEFANLTMVMSNMTSFSKAFEPMNLYLTPQCGDNGNHLNISRIFTNILEDLNKE